MPNVSISRCAYASLSQNAKLLRSFINITQGSNSLPGIITRPKSRLFSWRNIWRSSPLRKTETRGPICKNKTPLRGIESFFNSTFMVQLSQILNIRHLKIDLFRQY